MTDRFKIIKETADKLGRDPKMIKIIMFHFFKGIKQLYKEKIPFNEYGLFKTFVKYPKIKKK